MALPRPVSPLLRPFPDAPSYPRIPARVADLKALEKWCRDLLRVLDQQRQPLVNVVRNVSTTYTVETTNTNAYVIADPSGGAFTVTLPPVAGMVNYTVTVKNPVGSGANVTVSGGGATIDGSASITVIPGNARKLISNGTAWFIV